MLALARLGDSLAQARARCVSPERDTRSRPVADVFGSRKEVAGDGGHPAPAASLARVGLSLANTHPFVVGGVGFAHNGDIPNSVRLLDLLTDDERACLQGETDSERYFAVLRSRASGKPCAPGIQAGHWRGDKDRQTSQPQRFAVVRRPPVWASLGIIDQAGRAARQ